MSRPHYSAALSALLVALPGLLWSLGFSTSARSPWFNSGASTPAAAHIDFPSSIRVGIWIKKPNARMSCAGPYMYVSLAGGAVVNVRPQRTLLVSAAHGRLQVNGQALRGNLLIAPVLPDVDLMLNGHPYRGVLIVRPLDHGFLNVIEQIDLEEYLYGVVPREVEPEWPPEALKAQAVISRTFVLANLGQHAARGYDVSNDVFAQVYGGKGVEHVRTNQAVDATRGEILVDESGKPIQAFFHASCGGRTEAPQYVWHDIPHAYSYLVSIRDPYCRDDPFGSWRRSLSASILQRKLRRAGYPVGAITKIRITDRSPSGRATVFSIASGKKAVAIRANAFRLLAGPETLRSTLITRIERRGDTFVFEGHGWGHGVGLCQVGARGRALAGYSYAQILSAYYPHTSLVSIGVP